MVTFSRNPQDLALAALEVRAQAQDTDAFAALVTRYEKALESILASIVGCRERASDLVAEAVLLALRNLHRYERNHFSTWFFRIGTNLAISARRRQQRERRITEPGSPLIPELARKRADDPLQNLLRREEAARITDAIAALPPRYRKVLGLRYDEQLECREIARRLGTTPNSVSICLYRSKQRLRESLVG